MKKRLLAGSALCAAICFAASAASAQELEVAYATSYIDSGTFNARFSEDPVIQATLTLPLSETFYFEPYVNLDQEDGLDGASSEYGFALGGDFELGGCLESNIEGGRYMNYAGQGADVGDWFARASLSCGRASLAVVSFWGETDDTIVRADYEFSLGERLTFTPSIAYQIEGETYSPGAEFNLALTDAMSLKAQLVYPEVENDEGDMERELYGALRIAFTLGDD